MTQAGENVEMDIPAEDGDDYWRERRLCSDGSCIGVIGGDGCCKVCGKPGSPDDSSEPQKTGSPDDTETVPDGAAVPVAADPDNESPDDLDHYWAERKLCSDDNCIGVIGSDGKCRECGRPAAG